MSVFIGVWQISNIFYHNSPFRTLENILDIVTQHCPEVLKTICFVCKKITVCLHRKNWHLSLWHLLNETQPRHMHRETCFLFLVHVTKKFFYFSLKNLPINYAWLEYHLDTIPVILVPRSHFTLCIRVTFMSLIYSSLPGGYSLALWSGIRGPI